MQPEFELSISLSRNRHFNNMTNTPDTELLDGVKLRTLVIKCRPVTEEYRSESIFSCTV